MGADPGMPKIDWYRSPLSREQLARFNRRSDTKGMLQTGGYLGLLAVTGTAAFLAAGRLPWPAVVALLLFHGTCCSFLINAFHELVHGSVFRTPLLNRVFLAIVSFLGWHNPAGFWASHRVHHKYTLYPAVDPEGQPSASPRPDREVLIDLLRGGIVDPLKLYGTVKGKLRLSLGRLRGEWEQRLFPPSEPQLRRQLFLWSRVVLIGHLAVVAVSFAFGLWLLPVVVSLGPFYGCALYMLCNTTQHAGLADNVPDFRLNSRTLILSPFVRFLYWHMNYHIEHHMYVAVPCYHLGALHRAIRHDLPYCPRGLFATWRHIAGILKRQAREPAFRHVPAIPGGNRGLLS